MRNQYWLVFAAVLVWKIALFAFTVQPVPANDAYFYDGAMIHQILHGGFYNPCIKVAFPISGNQIFSAYPPLYQLPLFAWMSCFGVTAISLIGFHLVLFALYLWLVLVILRRIGTPAWCINVAGFFLLTITFHDRPDSFAHVLGVFALYACVRSLDDFRGDRKKADVKWLWLMAIIIVLAFCTSLQIGGIYFLVVLLTLGLGCLLAHKPVSLPPVLFMVVAPMLLVLLVKIALPMAWNGFIEHVRQTPFLTGLRVPQGGDLLKIGRTIPGIIFVTLFFIYGWFSRRLRLNLSAGRPHEVVFFATLLPAWGVVFGSLFLIAPNTIAISNYLQPFVVASYLAMIGSLNFDRKLLRIQVACLVPAILLGAIRAVGMTTWGVACSRDVNYSHAMEIVGREIDDQPKGYRLVMSSAFLYRAARRDDLDLIHSDWMAVAHGDSHVNDANALLLLKPAKIILTQFDYFRRYRDVLGRVQDNPSIIKIEVINSAHVPSPDSFESTQKIIQNVSWAPVIINLTWRNGN